MTTKPPKSGSNIKNSRDSGTGSRLKNNNFKTIPKLNSESKKKTKNRQLESAFDSLDPETQEKIDAIAAMNVRLVDMARSYFDEVIVEATKEAQVAFAALIPVLAIDYRERIRAVEKATGIPSPRLENIISSVDRANSVGEEGNTDGDLLNFTDSNVGNKVLNHIRDGLQLEEDAPKNMNITSLLDSKSSLSSELEALAAHAVAWPILNSSACMSCLFALRQDSLQAYVHCFPTNIDSDSLRAYLAFKNSVNNGGGDELLVAEIGKYDFLCAEDASLWNLFIENYELWDIYSSIHES